jgi:hypothetical protein
MGNRTLDLPACSVMPQATMLPRAPKIWNNSRLISRLLMSFPFTVMSESLESSSIFSGKMKHMTLFKYGNNRVNKEKRLQFNAQNFEFSFSSTDILVSTNINDHAVMTITITISQMMI